MDKLIFSFLCVIGAITVPVTSSPALLLTPYIEENRLAEARNESLVDPHLFLGVYSFSGFFTVDKKYNSSVFFWYFPKKKAEHTPWIIWLQGGPGCSSLIGLFAEIGPFEYVNEELRLRKTSWWNEYSMVFIDNPVGAGFSFTDHIDGSPRSMETYSTHLFSTVQQLTKLFPELRQAPLYVAGSSYAGHYVPALAMKIHEANTKDINLQGIILGNPVINRESVKDYTRAFYEWGLIDQQGALRARPLQGQYDAAIQNGQSELASDLREKLLDKLQEISQQSNLYNIVQDQESSFSSFKNFIMTDYVREAIHVGNLGFAICYSSLHTSLAPEFLVKVSPKVERLLENHSMLIYCGQFDLMTPCVQAAEERRRSWRWSGREQFLAAPRQPWWFGGSVAGYVKSGGGLTEVLVRGAGHLAPIDKPAEVQQLVSYFINGTYFINGMNLIPGNRQSSEPEPEYRDPEEDTSHVGLILSVFINVFLVGTIIALVLWFISWKKKNEPYFIPREDIFNVDEV